MADLIDRLREQSEWYSDGHGPLHKEAADEIARLRAALKPFADIGGRYPNSESDDKEIYHTNLGRLTLGEFRSAWVAMDDG